MFISLPISETGKEGVLDLRMPFNVTRLKNFVGALFCNLWQVFPLTNSYALITVRWDKLTFLYKLNITLPINHNDPVFVVLKFSLVGIVINTNFAGS